MKVEIEVSAVCVDLEDLETGEGGPQGVCTGVVLSIVAVHLRLVGLGGGHSLAGVVLESGIRWLGWLGNYVAGVRRACEGARARVDRWRGELLWGDVVLVLVIGIIRVGVVEGVVIAIVVRLVRLLVLVLVLLVVLLAIMRRDLRGSQRRRTGWLTERMRVPEPTVASATVLMRLGEVVGRARASKDVLVRRISRLWRRWSLCPGTHTTSRVHLSGRCGLRRRRAEGWVGGAQPCCRLGRGIGPSLGDGQRRRGSRPTRRTISNKLPGLLAFQPTALDAPLHNDRLANLRRRRRRASERSGL